VFEAVGRRDPDGIVELGALDYVDDFVAVGQFRGREAIRDFFRETFGAFPDFQLTVDRIVADGSSAVVQWRCRERSAGLRSRASTRQDGGWSCVESTSWISPADSSGAHHLLRRGVFRPADGLLPAEGSRADRSLVAAFNAATKLRRRR
jgi:hypothetical protein